MGRHAGSNGEYRPLPDDVGGHDLVALRIAAHDAVPFAIIVAQNRHAMPLLPSRVLLTASAARVAGSLSERARTGRELDTR